MVSNEKLLGLFLESQPTAKSPYGLYGYPPMWMIAEHPDGRMLFARPSRVMERPDPGSDFVETDGFSWQYKQGEQWLDQAYQSAFPGFAREIEKMIEKDGGWVINPLLAPVAAPKI